MDQGIIELKTPPKPVVSRQLDVPVTGMSCAACVARMARVAGKVPGVEAATVNLASERASLRTGPAFRLPDLAEALEKAGYPAAERTADLSITGMSCASCVGRVERALVAVPGVLTAEVNLADGTGAGEDAGQRRQRGLGPSREASWLRGGPAAVSGSNAG